jgi:putative cell wall-binding protein
MKKFMVLIQECERKPGQQDFIVNANDVREATKKAQEILVDNWYGMNVIEIEQKQGGDFCCMAVRSYYEEVAKSAYQEKMYKKAMDRLIEITMSCDPAEAVQTIKSIDDKMGCCEDYIHRACVDLIASIKKSYPNIW